VQSSSDAADRRARVIEPSAISDDVAIDATFGTARQEASMGEESTTREQPTDKRSTGAIDEQQSTSESMATNSERPERGSDCQLALLGEAEFSILTPIANTSSAYFQPLTSSEDTISIRRIQDL
jgi:hypothetical protein